MSVKPATVVPLFRAEVLHDLRARSFGSVILAQPVSHAVLTLLFSAFALGIVAFFVSFTYTRTAQVPGVLLPSRDPGRSVAGSQLEAELYAPSRSVGFVGPGMPVLLRYQAFPYQKFGQFRGVVREVSNAGQRPDEMSWPGVAQANGGAAEPLYRVRVELERQSVRAYGIDRPLKSGMTLDASVVLERRRLYEWVLDPLYTTTGRL